MLLSALAALSEARRAELARVVAASEFVGSVLIQDPAALEWFARHEAPGGARSANADYESRAGQAASTNEAQRILREWRYREMLRIAWRDIAGRDIAGRDIAGRGNAGGVGAGVVETLHELSDFADASIRAAVAAAQLHLQEVFGRPRDAGGNEAVLIVLGMGKLGGRELNFSSDIDLIFLFSEGGQTDGPRVAENEEYFNRLGREIGIEII